MISHKINFKIIFLVFLGISFIRNFCFSSFIKKSFKKIDARLINYAIHAVQQIYAEPICLILALDLFYFAEITDEIRALRQSSTLVTHHVAMIFLFNASFFILLWGFSFVVAAVGHCTNGQLNIILKIRVVIIFIRTAVRFFFWITIYILLCFINFIFVYIFYRIKRCDTGTTWNNVT